MMHWAGLWFHIDGLVHVIGRHSDHTWGRVAHADCGVELACIAAAAVKKRMYFVESNVARFFTHTFPTCLACWDASNFGSYGPR